MPSVIVLQRGGITANDLLAAESSRTVAAVEEEEVMESVPRAWQNRRTTRAIRRQSAAFAAGNWGTRLGSVGL